MCRRPPRRAVRRGSSVSSGHATPRPARSTCRRNGSRRRRPGRRDGGGPDGRRRRHHRDLHHRPHGVLAEPAGGVRRRRLRRRRPPPGRAHRPRRRRGRDRQAGRDDVPPAVHRRRDPRLLLEGPSGPRSFARARSDEMSSLTDQEPGRDHRDGVHPVRGGVGQGPRRPRDRRRRGGLRARPASRSRPSTRIGSAPRRAA